MVQTQLLGSQKALLDEQWRKLQIENDFKDQYNPEAIKVKQEQVLQEAINTAVLTATKKAKIKTAVQKMLQEQANTNNIKSRVEYETDLRKMGISPTSPTGVNILKALMLGVQYIYEYFLQNPGEKPSIINNDKNKPKG